MSTPLEFSRVLAARPSGFADGTNSTTVDVSNASSEPNARSRSRIRQASRPAGSLPCWVQTCSSVGFVRASRRSPEPDCRVGRDAAAGPSRCGR